MLRHHRTLTNQWLAIDATTPRRSWERSPAAPVDPFRDRVGPAVGDPDEVSEQWAAHPLAAAAPLIVECLGAVADEADALIAVTNAEGLVLWVEGNQREHVNEGVQAWTCAAAPVHDPDTGALLGVIKLTGRAASASPHAYTSVVATARAVESHLRSEMQERDVRLRAFAERVGRGEAYIVRSVDATHVAAGRRLRLRLLGRDRALIEQNGGTSRLTPRLTEVLALLAFRPAGMTSEELAADLYGDAGHTGAARVEVHRLRRVLAGAIETDPYRLAIDVESDVARIRALLDRGATREAAANYDGPLLPHSGAPGIVRDRDALDAWLRNAVMTGDDAEALWAWVQSRSGCDDLPAWKRLLAHLDFRDPRRSLAATQVASLRAAFAILAVPVSDRRRSS